MRSFYCQVTFDQLPVHFLSIEAGKHVKSSLSFLNFPLGEEQTWRLRQYKRHQGCREAERAPDARQGEPIIAQEPVIKDTEAVDGGLFNKASDLDEGLPACWEPLVQVNCTYVDLAASAGADGEESTHHDIVVIRGKHDNESYAFDETGERENPLSTYFIGQGRHDKQRYEPGQTINGAQKRHLQVRFTHQI